MRTPVAKFNMKMFQEFKNQTNKDQSLDNGPIYTADIRDNQLDDLASKRTQTRQPRSMHTQTAKKEPAYDRKNVDFVDNSCRDTRRKDHPYSDLFGEYKEQKTINSNKNGDYHYADNYTNPVKCSNHNHSNIFGNEPGNHKHGSELKNIPKLLPSVNYKEYIEQSKKNEVIEEQPDKYQLLMDNLSKSQVQDNETRSIYSRSNEKEKCCLYEYLLKGDPFSLQRISDADVKKDFLKNGFQVISLMLERHTVTNKGQLISHRRNNRETEVEGK